MIRSGPRNTQHATRNTFHVLRSTPYAICYLLLAILLSACSYTGYYMDAVQEEATGVVGELVAGRSAGQTFTAVLDGLARLDVPITGYARQNTHPVVFHLRPAPDATRDLITVTLPAESINLVGYTRIEFELIPNSASRSFYFELTAPEAVPGDAFTTYYNVSDVYPSGTRYMDGAPAQGDLAFRVYSRHTFTPGSVWADLASRAAQDKPFFAAYGLLIALAVGGLIWTMK